MHYYHKTFNSLFAFKILMYNNNNIINKETSHILRY